jgi:biopolymer transport protein TolQ
VAVDMTFVDYFFQASLIVKIVMLLLLGGSFLSWIIIFQKGFFLSWMFKKISKFYKQLDCTQDLQQLYINIKDTKHLSFMQQMFITGYAATDSSADNLERQLRVMRYDIDEALEKHLSFLATIGSVSPYIGLFGTVWGIMSAFSSLGEASQVTIAMVAPGISEALVATAMGLFAAIPAVIFYNRYVNKVNKIASRLDAFEETLINRLILKN